MNNLVQNPFFIIPILLIIFTAIAIILKSWHSARKVYAGKGISLEQAIRFGLENGEFDQSLVDLPKEEFLFDSPFGYRISGFFIPGKDDSSQTLLLSHGFGSNRWGMIKYASIFIKSGWNIVAFDHRRHGESGGESTSFGVFETQDMKVVADALFERFPKTRVFGLYGESMGAAIALQYAPMDSRLSFIVADCPFDNFVGQLRHLGKKMRIPAFLRRVMLKLTLYFIQSQAKYDPRSIRPGADIFSTSIPILFNHGGSDSYVPTIMSVKMYERRKSIATTDLHIYPGCAHAVSITKHRELYENHLRNWLSGRLGIRL